MLPHFPVKHPLSVLIPPIAALLLIVFSARPAKAQQVAPGDTLRLTVEEAIQAALAVSPEVGAVRSNQEFAEARYAFARANRFLTEFTATTAHSVAPSIDIPDDFTGPKEALYLDPDVRNDWSDLRPFNMIEVEALQPIWTWGQLSGSIRAARLGIEVESAAVEEKRLEVALRTGELYYGLLLAEALSNVAEEAGEVVQRAKREIERLLAEGAEDVDDADRYEVLLTEQEYNRRVVEVMERRQTAQIALARQLFLPPGAVAIPENTVLEPLAFELDSLDTYFDIALANRPELKRARSGLAALDNLVTVARSDYYPKLFLAASSRYAYVSGRPRQPNPYIDDPYLSRSVRAGVGFRQNLNFAQTRANVEQAEAERNEVAFQLDAARQLILFEVEEAYRNVIIAQAALESRQAALTLSSEWLQTEAVNFDLDLGDTENLVRAVRSNIELRTGYYQAVQEYNVAVLRFLGALGILGSRAETGTLVE